MIAFLVAGFDSQHRPLARLLVDDRNGSTQLAPTVGGG